MKTYTVKIKTPGHMIVFNGKRARTPVVYEHILEKDLSVFELQARRSMLEYEITDESTIVKESVIEEIEILKEDEDIEVEELSEKAEPSTILEKLLSDEE